MGYVLVLICVWCVEVGIYVVRVGCVMLCLREKGGGRGGIKGMKAETKGKTALKAEEGRRREVKCRNRKRKE